MKKKFISQYLFLLGCAGFTIMGFFIIITRIEVQPWYALWFLPFVYFLKPPKVMLWITTGFCLGLLLRYAPFLWRGDWNGVVPGVKLYVTILTPIVFGILFLLYSFIIRYGKK